MMAVWDRRISPHRVKIAVVG